jgi:RNA-directed DNA polymerase
MKDRPQERPSATVPPKTQSEAAKQAEEVRARWAWTDPGVWTDRMLTALESGVKGGQWFSLIDKVYAETTLNSAGRYVTSKSGKASGVDHVSPRHYQRDLCENTRRLSTSLRDGSYRPQKIRRTWIPKPGSREKRPLGIPTVRDRVVQTALLRVIEPIFERDFAEQSYGFRPQRGCKDALRRVEQLLKAGYVHVVDADLKGYFDTIPHKKLMARVKEKISDNRVLKLIEMYLKQDILDGLKSWTPEEGSPQGAVISPLLSNIYLNPLDHLAAEAGLEMVRYADDFVILCKSSAEAARALQLVQGWVSENGLTLHPEKTRVVDSTRNSFEFLGYRFIKHRRYPRRKSMQKFKDAIRAKTRRTNGRSLTCIVRDVNRTMAGWFEYFQHTSGKPFVRLDQFVRQRLRAILLKRLKRKFRGPPHGLSYTRWTIAYFDEQGLFNLTTALARKRQSSPR